MKGWLVRSVCFFHILACALRRGVDLSFIYLYINVLRMFCVFFLFSAGKGATVEWGGGLPAERGGETRKRRWWWWWWKADLSRSFGGVSFVWGGLIGGWKVG